MINDFDLLLKKCKARAFKRIMRIVFRIAGSIALVVAAIFSYQQWGTFKTSAPTNASPKAALPTPLEEGNVSLTAAAIPDVAKVTQIVQPTLAAVPSHAAILPTPIKIVSAPISAIAPTQSNRILEVSNEAIHPVSPADAYQRAPKFETALGIARDFYTKENYTEAAMWAKKANQMNREAEEAWLLYAKSYYAQGKKAEAIGVLELFLNYKDSKAASELLRSWR